MLKISAIKNNPMSYVIGLVLAKITLKYLIINLVLVLLIGIGSQSFRFSIAQTPDEIEKTQMKLFLDYELNTLKKIKHKEPYIYSKIDWSNYQRNNGILTIPIIENSKMTSRIVITKPLAYIINYQNWENQIEVLKFEEDLLIQKTSNNHWLKDSV